MIGPVQNIMLSYRWYYFFGVWGTGMK